MSAAPPDPFTAYAAPAAASGWRVAVKDMIAVAGAPQAAGIAARAGIVAERDAAVVRQFRAAGHTIVGVTHTDAGGFGTMTDCVANPTFPARAVGGSSGGSAAAVAADLADVALGTDTGGSVRIPAAYCGTFGYKPSAGRVPMDGILALSTTLDHPGVMTRDAATLAAAAAVLVPDWKEAPLPSPLRLAYAAEALDVSQTDVADAFAALCARLGATPLTAPAHYDTMAAASSNIICAEALGVHEELWRRDPGNFPPLAAGGLEYAATLSAQTLAEAHADLAAASRAWRAALEGVDVLLTPTLPMAPAPRHATSVTIKGRRWPITDANIRLCQFANVAGLPAIAAPWGERSIQFVGRFGQDEALMAAAMALLSQLTP